MRWRLARSLDVLRGQIDELSPHRSTESDGSIGDAAHAARTSDHNPWVKDGNLGVVTAIDITHDPAHGIDAGALAEALIASRDARIKYVISRRRIASGTGQGHPAWSWRPYGGVNPHDKHVHISVKPEKALYDSADPWRFHLDVEPAQASLPTQAPPRPTLKQGARGAHVSDLQIALNRHGAMLVVDGEFGPLTRGAVMAFQRSAGLVIDGICGPYTWRALDA